MDDVAKKARARLVSYMERELLCVFATAYTLQWTSEANNAANEALGSAAFYERVEVPELDFVPERFSTVSSKHTTNAAGL